MKHFIKLLFLLPFIMPFSSANADNHDDATMDVLEHDSAEVFHEVTLPEETGHHAEVKHHVELPSHASENAREHVNERHSDKDDDTEAEKPEVEKPEVEKPEIEDVDDLNEGKNRHK